ncbi:hypothetical protein L1987_29724 [Smallanthus sonchifolius]|uniref:Uncharacterized protein n=1 Tax=Smallanthus sonchifolius TaxID=185202 RepID=A0ACB9I0T8_9ASTR|nr:hypothetical protein L1987_29724 [Smallanthus sonchifolius]
MNRVNITTNQPLKPIHLPGFFVQTTRFEPCKKNDKPNNKNKNLDCSAPKGDNNFDDGDFTNPSPPSYVFVSPNGTKLWCPNVIDDIKPIVGLSFDKWEDVIAMYQNYAFHCGFSIHKGQTKVYKGVPTHKYLRCTKAGKPQSKHTFDTLCESSLKSSQSTFTQSDCPAHISIVVCQEKLRFVVLKFSEAHNHEFVDRHNLDLTKISRKLNFSSKQFIHKMSLNRVGPIQAHRCLVAMKGGHHNVNDEISKLNYNVFGDVVAFDATYHTNKYNMIFVPFTGDPSMRQAILEVFNESRHRLCMWHIMKKLLAKITADLFKNANIRAEIHRLVWNVYIKPSTFENRWEELISKYPLANNQWLKDMYEIRDRWVPAYFRDIPLCCLMKTTSRCESSNAAFNIYSSSANTCVQFMLCFETRIDSQRYRQRMSEFKTSTSTLVGTTDLPIESHAFSIYSHEIFFVVRKEITKGKLFCYISNTEIVDDIFVFQVTHLDRRNDATHVFQVRFNSVDNSASCSCMGFTRIGNLCRHIFCVYRLKKVERIPTLYILNRWMRDVIPKRVYSIEYRYGVDNTPQSVMRNEILEIVTECFDVVRSDTDSLVRLVEHLREIKLNLTVRSSTVVNQHTSDDFVILDLVGQPLDVEIEINNPDVAHNKGCGKHRRLIGPGEKQSTKPPKSPCLSRTCNEYVIDHDSRNCKKRFQESNNDAELSTSTLFTG